jgi:UDP-N-acetylmuramate dehydrogenase
MNIDIQRNVDLQGLNTLAIAARAENYVAVTTIDELRQALQRANSHQWPVLLLGGGSNVVLPEYVRGLTIRIALEGIQLAKKEGDAVWITAGAGVVWHSLVQYALQHGYYGLENLSLIPGTVGAAPLQNIGAYGIELDTVFDNLQAIDRHSLHDVTLYREQCEFAYRHSIFKGDARHRFVITAVTFKLSTIPSINIRYPALAEAVAHIPAAQLTPQMISDTVCAVRRQKLPDPALVPNVGSFFKNPIVDKSFADDLKLREPQLVTYPVAVNSVKIAAGWLVDRAGWRGYLSGGVGVHSQQALVLINPGRCSSEKILALAAEIQRDVEKKFNVVLEIEPDVVV